VTGTSRLRALALAFGLAAAPAGAAPYVVDGLTLGGKVALNNQNYRSYSCKPSEQFEDYTLCERTQPRNTSAGRATYSSRIVHDEDGTAIDIAAKLAPVSITRNDVQKEIDDLSKTINERPAKIEWVPARAGVPASVIVVWGRVELRRLKSDDVEEVANGYGNGLGVLVDPLGDPVRSAKAKLPIYRIAGGAGYVYSASFDGRGHRAYEAVDVSAPAIKKFVPAIQEVLDKDKALASNDYSQWPDVAELTRNLTLSSSADIANEALDKVFEQYPSKKLRSHVWSLLPLGSLYNLPQNAYWSQSVYGPKTEYPEIREAIQKFVAAHPKEPFVEFLLYTIGDFEKALEANPNSVIASVFRYAIGYRILASLLEDSLTTLRIPKPQDYGEPVNQALVTLNSNPGAYDNKLLGTVVRRFAERAAAAKPWFEMVLKDQTSPHRDDAGYMLGWLAFHQGNFKDSLDYLKQAMEVGNGDFSKPAAMRQTVRIMTRMSASEQVALVQSNPTFTKQPALWYMAARSLYREFQYATAVDTAQRALAALNVPLDQLPATTDPKTIREAMDKVEPKLDDDLNLYELPYLLEASREILQFENYLKTAAVDRSDNVSKRVRAIVIKYTMLLDPPGKDTRRPPPELAHRDLRQGAHLIDMALAGVPKNAQMTALREWLHYRKVRVMAQYAPKTAAAAVAAMEQEFPKSDLMDDALAEEIYAEGVWLRDVSAAQRTFQKLLANFPRGNAVDNAYTWMGIIYRCEGRADDAQKINRDILRLFPMTRHARYARARMANPRAASCGFADLRR
jgi:tetratricopeptide (TPR) repeat protein